MLSMEPTKELLTERGITALAKRAVELNNTLAGALASIAVTECDRAVREPRR